MTPTESRRWNPPPIEDGGHLTLVIPYLLAVLLCFMLPQAVQADSSYQGAGDGYNGKIHVTIQMEEQAITVRKSVGKVTCKKVKGSKVLTVNKKTGKITVRKNTKADTYKIKVKVTAAGNKTTKKLAKTVTVTIKVE